MPDGPIGTKQHRIRKALHWHWTTDMTQEEMADKLGVSQGKVSKYIREAPTSKAVQDQLETMEAEVRFIAVKELREQLKAAGSRARSAEKPVKIWENANGDLHVVRKKEGDKVVDRYPIPWDFELGVDEKGRYFGRQEVREILDLLTDIVGAKAADRQEIELSGEVGTEHTVSDEDRDWLEKRFGDDGSE